MTNPCCCCLAAAQFAIESDAVYKSEAIIILSFRTFMLLCNFTIF